MKTGVDITTLADKVANAGVLANNLLDAGFEKAAILAVRKKTEFNPNEFQELLMTKQF